MGKRTMASAVRNRIVMKDDKVNVSEAELQSAIRRFVEAGGMIRKLPDQKSNGSRMVGRRHNASEMAGELS